MTFMRVGLPVILFPSWNAGLPAGATRGGKNLLTFRAATSGAAGRR
jgi:hypothetical protein